MKRGKTGAMVGLIVGCGSVGRRHIRNLRALGDVELIAYRHSARDSADLPQELGVRTFFDVDEALALRPDFAVVANPTGYHMPISTAAANAGCDLFIEKPISDSLQGMGELRAAIEEQGSIVMIGYNLRFHPGLRCVRKLIDDGRIGRVVSIRAQAGQYLPDWHPSADYRHEYSARRDLGGGVILDLSHEVDYVRWLVGEVEEVGCMSDHISGLDIETEDVAEILLRFVDGAIGSVHVDYVQRIPSRTCKVIGEKGTIVWDYHANTVRCFSIEAGGWETHEQRGVERNDTFVGEMKHFLECVREGVKPSIGIDEGIRVLEILLAAQRAAATGARQTI